MTPSKSVVHSTKINLLFFLAVFLGGLVVTGVVYTQGKFHIDRDVLMNVREKYGWAAYKRLVSWEELLQGDGDETNIVKLQKVNAFFNKNTLLSQG